jgi:putative ABC transport system permease protein
MMSYSEMKRENEISDDQRMQRQELPSGVRKFLRLICPVELIEEIEGDLIQKFANDVTRFGERRAKKKLLWNTVRFLRPGILMRNRFSLRVNPFYMLDHFAKVFFRNTVKNGGYSFINIAGLTTGLACSIFILLWVVDEVRFDKFNEERDRIYKVMTHHTYPTGIFTYDDTPGPLAPALMDLPEVEASARITFGDRTMLNHEEKSTYQRCAYADPSIFEIFTMQMFAGAKRDQLLRNNNSIVISKSLADIYFPNEDAIGKILRVNNNLDCMVTGVFVDRPENSSVQFDFILPYDVYAKDDQYNNEWGAWTGGQLFVKLRASRYVSQVTKKIDNVFTRPKIWVRWDSNVELFLLPLNDLRLNGNFQNGIQQGGRIKYVVIFSAVAAFILLIACVNFVNLSTARSLFRAREIGVRKIAGAAKGSLIRQFLGESLLISFLALLLAILTVHLLLPNLNELTQKEISIDYTDPFFCGIIILLTVVTGIIAGGYPAFLLSSFKPLNVFSGSSPTLKGNSLRKALVIFQFGLSVVMIISATVVDDQIEYMRNKDLGFERDNIFYINLTDGLRKNFSAFREDVLQSPTIENVAQSDANPMEIFRGMVLADNAWPGKRKEDNIIFRHLRCDEQLLPLLDFTILKGRNFSPEFPSDSVNYIINEEAARQMNLADPIGEYFVAPVKGQIVGVIKDFHSGILKGPIEPVIVAFNPKRTDKIFVRFTPGHLEEAIRDITHRYKKHEPDFPPELSFMNETFGRQYKDELVMGRLSTYFTAIAILISCLGLVGLASFSAGRRSKEIGIRKVMGATAGQMIALLCKDFMKLIIIALMIGLPVAWWLVNRFLDEYAYRVDPGIAPYVMSAISVIGIALLTVAYQSSRAAIKNPAYTLRSEN